VIINLVLAVIGIAVAFVMAFSLYNMIKPIIQIKIFSRKRKGLL